MFTLLFDRHSLLRLTDQLCACDWNRDLRRLSFLQIVVNDARERDCVALRQKPRRFNTQDHIFARDDFVFRDADHCVAGDASCRRAPRGQVIRQTKLHCRAAVFSGNDSWVPVSSVFKVFADHWLFRIALVFEVSQLIRRFCFRKIDWLFAGDASEVVRDREVSLHRVVAHAVELLSNISRVIRRKAVDRFVNYA